MDLLAAAAGGGKRKNVVVDSSDEEASTAFAPSMGERLLGWSDATELPPGMAAPGIAPPGTAPIDMKGAKGKGGGMPGKGGGMPGKGGMLGCPGKGGPLAGTPVKGGPPAAMPVKGGPPAEMPQKGGPNAVRMPGKGEPSAAAALGAGAEEAHVGTIYHGSKAEEDVQVGTNFHGSSADKDAAPPGGGKTWPTRKGGGEAAGSEGKGGYAAASAVAARVAITPSSVKLDSGEPPAPGGQVSGGQDAEAAGDGGGEEDSVPSPSNSVHYFQKFDDAPTGLRGRRQRKARFEETPALEPPPVAKQAEAVHVEDTVGFPAAPPVLKSGRPLEPLYTERSRPAPHCLLGYSGRIMPPQPLPRSAQSWPERVPITEGRPASIVHQMLRGAKLAPRPIPRSPDLTLEDPPPPPGARPVIDYARFGGGQAGANVRLVPAPLRGEARLAEELSMPEAFVPRFSPFPFDGREGQVETRGNEGRPVAAPLAKPKDGSVEPAPEPALICETAELVWAPLAWRPEHGADRTLADFEEPDISDDDIL